MSSWKSRRAAAFLVLLLGSVFWVGETTLDYGPVAGGLRLLCTTPFLLSVYPIFLARRVDYFQPIVFLTLNLLLGVTFRLSLLLGVVDAKTNALFLLGQNLDFFYAGAFWINVAVLLFLLGYALNYRVQSYRPKLLRHGIESWKTHRVFILVCVLAVVSAYSIYDFATQLSIDDFKVETLSRKRTLRIDGEKVALGYHRLGAGLSETGFYIVLIFMLLRRKRWLSSWGVLALLTFGLSVFFPILTSSRIGVVFVVFNAVLIVSYLREINLVKFAPLALFMLLVLGVMTRSRDGGHKRTDSSELVEGLSISEVLGTVIYNRNHLGLTKTAHIIDGVPTKLPYAYGSTLTTWIFAPIPKTLWPEKPPVLTGPAITQHIYGKDPQKNGGVPPGLVADLYWNFGPLGIILGYFLAGVGTKIGYQYFYRVRKNPNALLLYIVVIYSLVFVLHSNGVIYAITTLLQSFIPTVLFILIMSAPTLRLRPVPARATAAANT